jgi:hypothetical protein
MKKLLIGVFALMTTGVFAQVGWPSGAMTVKTAAYDTAYVLTTNNKLTYVSIDSLTGVFKFKAPSIAAPNGSEVVLKVTSKSATRGVVFTNGVVGATDSVAANKTVYYTFKKLGGSLILTAKNQIN